MNDNDLLNYLRDTGYGEVLIAAVGQALTDETVTAPNGDVHSVREAAPELQRLGLAHVENRMSGPIVQANGRGKQIAQRIQQSREAGPDRWDAVERAIITDLLQEHTRFEGDWGVDVVDGREVAETERINAMTRLSDWGYLKGVSADQANGFIRIDVTPKAAEVAGIHGLLANHHNGSVSSYTDQSTHNTTSVGGNAHAIQTGGTGNVQTVTITTVEQSQILAGIGQVRAAMGDDAQPELIEAVDAIETEARSESATKASIGQQVQSALITAGATAASTEVFQGLTNLLSLALG